MTRRVWIIGGAVLVAVAALVALLVWPRGADPLSQEDAVEAFRGQGGSDPGAQSGSDGTAAGTPEPGVYSYTGAGSETVQLGPIPAETREFPAEISGVVTDSDPISSQSCFVTTLNLIEQHTEDTTYCRTADGGLRLEHYEKHQKISAFDPTVDIRCDPGVLWEPGAAESPLECVLTLLGGPMEVTADLSGTARATEGDTVVLDGAERAVVSVEMHFDLEGSITGSWDEKLTFSADDTLLLGVDRLFELDGFASFLEDFDYRIGSGIPTR